MIFGIPGSGKSTFANSLGKKLNIPVEHLDRYFFIENWVERDYEEFLAIQKSLVEQDSWIIDGNATRSLEMRYKRATICLYFKYNRLHCLWRILKRLFFKDPEISDRAEGCSEKVRFRLLRYMWGFDKRVRQTVSDLRKKYPEVSFYEITNAHDLSQKAKF